MIFTGCAGRGKIHRAVIFPTGMIASEDPSFSGQPEAEYSSPGHYSGKMLRDPMRKGSV
jgi:hypothetical protein